MKNVNGSTKDAVREWMYTFSMVGSLEGNDAALARELDTIAGVFSAERADRQTIDETFKQIKMTSDSRAWPTAAQVLGAMREVIRRRSGERITVEGNRSILTSYELSMLEDKVLPTARRWLRQYPGLRSVAIQTLQYWGEPLIDDQGKTYKA